MDGYQHIVVQGLRWEKCTTVQNARLLSRARINTLTIRAKNNSPETEIILIVREENGERE